MIHLGFSLLVILPAEEIKRNEVFLSSIKGHDNTVKKGHNTDDKRTHIHLSNNMEQQRTKSKFTLIGYRDDAQPWDDFIIKTDSSTTSENDIK